MPKGLRKIEVSFEEPHLTHFAGMCLIQWFCQKLGLRRLLQRHLRPAPRCREYHPADMILAILYAIIAGMDRVNETQILQYNGAFQKLVGLHRFPGQTAIRRFLKRLTPPTHPADSPHPRSDAAPPVRPAPPAHQSRLRAGFHGAGGLRAAGRGRPGRVQPQEPRPPVLPSAAGVRIPLPGVLAWVLPARRCRDLHRGRALPEGLSGQGPPAPAPVAPPVSPGCGALQPADGGVSRRGTLRVRDRGQGVRADQSPGAGLPVHPAPHWLGGRRVPVPAPKWTQPRRFVVVRRPIPTDPVEAKQLTLFKDKKYV